MNAPLVERLIGEIFPLSALASENFLPCDGRELRIADYPELYAVIGIVYGGNGLTTFAVPDLRGRIPAGISPPPASPNAPSLLRLGEQTGAPSATLTPAHLPSHQHPNPINLGTAHSVSLTFGAVTPEVFVETYDEGGSEMFPGGHYLAGLRQTSGGLQTARSYVLGSNIGSQPPGELAGVSAQELNLRVQGHVEILSSALADETGDTGENEPFSITPPTLGVPFVIVAKGIMPFNPTTP